MEREKEKMKDITFERENQQLMRVLGCQSREKIEWFWGGFCHLCEEGLIKRHKNHLYSVKGKEINTTEQWQCMRYQSVKCLGELLQLACITIENAELPED